MSDFNEYQSRAVGFAVYPETHRMTYPALGLTGEAGEVAEKIKKIIRDKDGCLADGDRAAIAKELGDVLWYAANLANDIGVTLQTVADMNIEKLESRKDRGVLQGSGDER